MGTLFQGAQGNGKIPRLPWPENRRAELGLLCPAGTVVVVTSLFRLLVFAAAQRSVR